MTEKINPLPTKNHPDFWNLLKELQDARVKKGKETSQNPMALWKLTKTIENMIRANEKFYKALVEVNINGNKH